MGIEYGLHPGQWDVFHEARRHRYLLAGRDWGKDHVAQTILLDDAGRHGEGHQAFYVGQSHAQVKRIAWKRLKRQIPRNLLAKKPNETELTITFRWGPTLTLLGSENVDAIRGVDANFLVITEFAFCQEDVWEVAEGCLRTSDDRALLITTPNGPNHAQTLWEQIEGDPEWARWQLPTWSRPDHDAKSLEAKKHRLASNVFNQEYGAQFDVQKGAVYQNFSVQPWPAGNLAAYELDRSQKVYVGQDYNNGFIAASIAQVKTVVLPGSPKPERCLVLLEDFLTTTTIEAHAIGLKKWFQDRGINHEQQVVIYSDASGEYNARSAKPGDVEGRSDNRVMRNHGFHLTHPGTNPAVMDRIHALQGLVLNGAGQRRLLVHPTRCPHSKASLQNQVFNDWGKPDKTKGYDHFNDANGYMAHGLFPVRGGAFTGRAA